MARISAHLRLGGFEQSIAQGDQLSPDQIQGFCSFAFATQTQDAPIALGIGSPSGLERLEELAILGGDDQFFVLSHDIVAFGFGDIDLPIQFRLFQIATRIDIIGQQAIPKQRGALQFTDEVNAGHGIRRYARRCCFDFPQLAVPKYTQRHHYHDKGGANSIERARFCFPAFHGVSAMVNEITAPVRSLMRTRSAGW